MCCGMWVFNTQRWLSAHGSLLVLTVLGGQYLGIIAMCIGGSTWYISDFCILTLFMLLQLEIPVLGHRCCVGIVKVLIGMYETFPYTMGCSTTPVWQFGESILNLHPIGLTKHAGKGQATDGRSIPYPGWTFTFSLAWISLCMSLSVCPAIDPYN